MATCAMGYAGGSGPVKPEIIVWGADTDYLKVCEPQLSSEDTTSVSKHAVRAVVERLSDQDVSLHLTVAEQNALTDAFRPAIDKVLARRNVENHVKIHGRFQAGFQSNVFSPSGRYIYLLAWGCTSIE